MKHHSLLLDASDLCALVERLGRDQFLDELIARLETEIRHYDPEVARIPPRNGVHYRKPEWGLIEAMPAHFGEAGTTVKLVGYHPANPERYGMPSVVSTIAVFGSRTGHLEGMLDGTFLTALRTGAASAVASRVLASPASRCVGVIGCGAQAVTQVHAMARCFDIGKVIGFDIDAAASGSLAARLAFLGIPVETVGREGRSGLLRSADILCTCTSSIPGEGPVFEDFANRPHLHINAVGSDFDRKYELPLALLERSLVCPDFREQAVVEGDCQQLGQSRIGPDLWDLVQHGEDYVEAQERLTVFDSTGWALEDHVAARMVLDYAEEMKLGRETEMECVFPDPKDPYSLLSGKEIVAGA